MDFKEKVIVFGLGKRLKRLKAEGLLDELEIIAYCDNDKEKLRENNGCIKIICPEKIKEYTYDAVYISSKRYENAIRKQLIEECEVPDDKIKTFKIQDEKHRSEIDYWKEVFKVEGREFHNSHYKDLMLSIAQENDDTFLKDKVIADFGCGPRGSLAWTNQPSVKLGIDVLAEQYLEEFEDELVQHNMIYVTSSENKIPVPDSFVDYLCTINSLDHVDNLESMVSEILRIIKPNGIILASFNLNEPSTECEPQTLTEKILQEKLLKYFTIISYRLAYPGETNVYDNLRKNNLIRSIENNNHAILWVKGIKR